MGTIITKRTCVLAPRVPAPTWARDIISGLTHTDKEGHNLMRSFAFEELGTEEFDEFTANRYAGDIRIAPNIKAACCVRDRGHVRDG